MRIWGLEGLWGGIVLVTIIQRIAQKLCRVVLLHFGIVPFRIHFGRDRKPIIFIIFGPIGHDHDSKNQHYPCLGTPVLRVSAALARHLLLNLDLRLNHNKIRRKSKGNIGKSPENHRGNYEGICWLCLGYFYVKSMEKNTPKAA